MTNDIVVGKLTLKPGPDLMETLGADWENYCNVHLSDLNPEARELLSAAIARVESDYNGHTSERLANAVRAFARNTGVTS